MYLHFACLFIFIEGQKTLSAGDMNIYMAREKIAQVTGIFNRLSVMHKINNAITMLKLTGINLKFMQISIFMNVI